MSAKQSASAFAFRLFAFSVCWMGVSCAAFIDVFVFAKERDDIETATEEFHMDASMRAAIYSAFYLGWLIGDPFFGWIADLWGRHPAVYAATALGFFFTSLCSLAVGPYSLFTLRFVGGVCLGGADLVAFVHIMELSAVDKRATAGSVMQMFFATGICLSAAIAVTFPSWRQMYLISALPTVMFLGSYFWIPESPKWLSRQLRLGKLKGNEKVSHSDAESAEQHRSLLHVANDPDGQNPREGINGKLVPEDDVESAKAKQHQEEFTYAMLIKDSDTSALLMLICVLWLVCGFLYYGITLSAGSISKEIHLNMFLMGIVEIPAYILAMYLADATGRRPTFASLTTAAGVFCLISWTYPTQAGRLLFALIGKIFAAGSMCLVWLWSPEIFPTGARSLTTAIGSQACRVGSILAPYVVVLMAEMPEKDANGVSHPALPQPIFAVSAFVAVAVSYFVPETKGKEMV